MNKYFCPSCNEIVDGVYEPNMINVGDGRGYLDDGGNDVCDTCGKGEDEELIPLYDPDEVANLIAELDKFCNSYAEREI